MSDNTYNIPMINNTGDGITITNFDANMPPGKLEGMTSNQVVDKWIEENYPNTMQEELSNIGINVSFEEGGRKLLHKR